MNRNRFNAPPPENRMAQNIYSNPPPNFNWQGPTEYVPPNEYPVQTNGTAFNNSPTQPAFSQSAVKNNYCKTCNLWTSEPYESHITSSAHLSKKANVTRAPNQIYEPNITSEQHMIKKPVPRTSNVPYEPINPQPLHMPKKAVIRNNNQPYEPITTVPLHMPKKSTARVAIPPYKAAPATNESDNMASNVNNNKRPKNRKNKIVNNNQNPTNFHQNNYQPHIDGPHCDKIDNDPKKKVDETFKSMPPPSIVNTTAPMISNRGREMLFPVSGIYCTLCDEFFRNTDKAETQHCNSSPHLKAYEKLIGELNDAPHDKRPLSESNEDCNPPKRPKCTPVGTAIKSEKPVSKFPDSKLNDYGKKCDVAVPVVPVAVRDPVDIDQSSSSEFQGPDVSLEFPDEIEDYDEGESPL